MTPEERVALRRQFAGMALQGILANPDPQFCQLSVSRAAEFSVEQADALIAELERTESGAK